MAAAARQFNLHACARNRTERARHLHERALANLGWDQVRLPDPGYEGDTIYSQSEVISARESQSRPNAGIVVIETIGFDQDGIIVISFRRTVIVYRQGHGPTSHAQVQPRWNQRLQGEPSGNARSTQG